MPSARFRAATSRDPALDGLRGVAILLVFIFHYGGGLRSAHPLVRALGYFTETGWTGVILFFALSGFLITGSLWDSRDERDAVAAEPASVAKTKSKRKAVAAPRAAPVKRKPGRPRKATA